jgi:anti-sigma factor RsiW
MVEKKQRRGLSCEQARERIHQVLDGDLMDATQRVELDDHLERCDECRAADTELRTIQDALRKLAPKPMPEAAIDDVWSRTSRPQPTSILAPVRRQWWAAAAAAVLAVALWGTWHLAPPVGSEPTPEQVARATEEMQMVFGLTARALRDARQATEEVLAGEVSPAMKRAPIRWPGTAGTERRESANGV